MQYVGLEVQSKMLIKGCKVASEMFDLRLKAICCIWVPKLHA